VRRPEAGPLNVVVLMGGQSAEREVSLDSARTVLKELRDAHQVRAVEILADGSWSSEGDDPVAPLEALRSIQDEGVDVVYNSLHGPLGEDGSIQGLFRILEIPLTGPDFIPAAVTMDKRLTKLALQATGIATPRHVLIENNAVPTSPEEWSRLASTVGETLPFPWVLKPNRLGSSVGVFMAASVDELRQLGPSLGEQGTSGDDLLIEEVIQGRELSCPVLQVDGRVRVLPPIEIRPRDRAFFDYHAKYTAGATEDICPAPLTPVELDAVETTAQRVHELFGCEPLSRTDMFLTPTGEIQVLEINTLPGMTKTSLVPLAASKVQLSLKDLLSELLYHAIERAARQGYAHGKDRHLRQRKTVV
jgi:D-alanine-D-alanine ligase